MPQIKIDTELLKQFVWFVEHPEQGCAGVQSPYGFYDMASEIIQSRELLDRARDLLKVGANTIPVREWMRKFDALTNQK
jgi:hypothetical protein